MSKLLFVGECRSLTAQRKGWTWKDGRLAAKPLFEALAAMGVDASQQDYINLWSDNATGQTPGSNVAVISWQKVERLRGYEGVLVALGKRVSDELTKRSIEHVALVHPAARGKIRKRERYHAHVREKLAPVVTPKKVMFARLREDSSDSIYTFFVATKRGERRVYPPGIGKHDEAATTPSETLAAWLAKLGITHVTSKFGNDKTDDACIKDGTYTVESYLRWWRRAEKAAQ